VRLNTGRQCHACSELRAGTDGAGQSARRASPMRGLRSSPSTGAGGCEFVSPSRGPPDRAGLGDEKDRVGGPAFQNIGAFERRTRSVRASVRGGRMERRPTGMSLLRPCVLAAVIASPAAAVLAMAFSHINLDASATPPWCDDPCPGGSKGTADRCCGLNASRFLPRRGRQGGVARSSSERALR